MPCLPACLQFDKDDALAVEFVTAAANLRALCYGIRPLPLFDAKVGWQGTLHIAHACGHGMQRTTPQVPPFLPPTLPR